MFDRASFIQQARQQGVPDRQIQVYLEQKGLIPSNTSPRLKDTGSFLGNVANSAGQFGSNLATAVANPIDTAKALGSTFLGGFQKLVPGRQKQEDNFDAVVDFFKERYGSMPNLKETLYQDPIGALADASTLLGGASLAARGLQLPRAASALSKAGATVDPIMASFKPFARTQSWLGNLPSKLEEANLRLTPTQATKLSSKMDRMTNFVNQHVPVGTPAGRFQFVDNLYTKFEDIIQSTLQADDVVQSTQAVPKTQIIAKLESVLDNYRNDPANFPTVQRQLNDIIKNIDANSPDYLQPNLLNDYKRSFTNTKAYDKLGVEVKSELNADIGRVFQESVENTLATLNRPVSLADDLRPIFGGAKEVPIDQFNQTYGTIITLRKLLKAAQNKPETNFLNRLVLQLVGASLGGQFGGFVGAGIGGAVGATAANTVPLTAIRSSIGKAATRAAKVRVPAGVRILTPATQLSRVRRPSP